MYNQTKNIFYAIAAFVIVILVCIFANPLTAGATYYTTSATGGYTGSTTCTNCGSSSGSSYYTTSATGGYTGSTSCSGGSCGYTYTTTTSCGSSCSSCTNQCSTSGQRVCSGSGYKTCGNYDSDKCLEWSSVTSCGAGKTCSNGSCISTCSDECTTSGKRECYQGGYRQCGNHDSDSCLEWGTVTNCGANERCSNGSCIESCSDDCATSGLRVCSGNGWKQCGNYDSDSCLDWGTVTDCDSDETCSNGSCKKTCTDECTKKDQRVCSGSGYKTCGNYDSDSCMEWSTITDCDEDETCTNGSCIEDRIDICTDTLSGSPTSKQQQMCDAEGGTMLCGNGWCKCNCEHTNPSVELTVSGGGKCGEDYILKWTSNDVVYCAAGGDWSGGKQPSGSESIGSFDDTKYFAIGCTDTKGKQVFDSVTVDGKNDGSDLEVSAGEDIEIDEDEDVRLDGEVDGDYDDVEWDCTDGDLSDDNSLRPTFEAPEGDWDYDKVFTCTLTAENECGKDSDSVKIRVNYEEEDEDIDVELTVDSDNGCAALNDVDLKAEVDDDSKDEQYKYYFDCESDGDWDKTITVDDDTYTAKNLCDYDDPGTYTAKVKVTSAGRSATDTATVKVKDCKKDEKEGRITITKSVQNVSSGTSYGGTVSATPGQVVGYRIVIKATDGDAKDVFLIDRVPNGIINVAGLVVDGKRSDDDIKDGIKLGDIDKGDSIVVTYTAMVADASNFGFGQTPLTNVASVSVDGNTASSEATVNVYRQAVQGATTVSTGFDGGSAAAVMAAGMGMLLALSLVVKKGLKPKTAAGTDAELISRIEYVKKNNLIG